jgi:hypothetical protein
MSFPDLKPSMSYTVKEGDTLKSIASRVLKSTWMVPIVRTTNKDVKGLQDVKVDDKIPAGTQLRLPVYADVREFLDALRAKRPNLKMPKYRYPWWEQPKFVVYTWTIGGLVVIGGIWPTVINLLVFRRFFRPKTEKKPKEKWWRRRKVAVAAAKVASGPVDYSAVKTQISQMEEGLAGFLKPAKVDVETEAENAQVVKKLSGEALETTAPTKAEEEKEYGGQYYPTVAHAPVHKKPESQAKDKEKPEEKK